MIGIITAMSCEAQRISSQMKKVRSGKVGMNQFIRGKIGDNEVVLSVCGVGKVFAGACTQTMIVDFGCTHIINVGVAGALDEKLDIGEICTADNVVQHDMDTSAVGDPVGMISGINVVKMPCDEDFNDKLCDFVKNEYADKKVVIGTIATGDTFFKEDRERRRISQQFDAVVGEMEGGAIGQICYANSVPFNVIRIITDKAGENSGGEYADNRDKCADALADIIVSFLKVK